jgi:hypothetical protein
VVAFKIPCPFSFAVCSVALIGSFGKKFFSKQKKPLAVVAVTGQRFLLKI